MRAYGDGSLIVRFTDGSTNGGSDKFAEIEAPRKLVMIRKFEKHPLQGARMRRDLLAFIALAIALFFPLPGLAQFTTSALIAKSPDIDIKKLTHKANSGNPEAQFELGLAYEKGLDVDNSQSEATRWYRSAAKSGYTQAQYYLAYLYETGPDGIKDIGETVKWYKRAAVYGSAFAQFNLGRLYASGYGVQQSNEEAAHWMQEAADGGYADALAVLALNVRLRSGQ